MRGDTLSSEKQNKRYVCEMIFERHGAPAKWHTAVHRVLAQQFLHNKPHTQQAAPRQKHGRDASALRRLQWPPTAAEPHVLLARQPMSRGRSPGERRGGGGEPLLPQVQRPLHDARCHIHGKQVCMCVFWVLGGDVAFALPSFVCYENSLTAI